MTEPSSAPSGPSFKQKSHLNPVLASDAIRTLNVDQLLGRWVNTNPASRMMVDFEIRREGETFTVRASGAGEAGPIPWPAVPAEIFANLEEEEGQKAVAFAAVFRFDYMETRVQIRVNKGVLVVVMFNRFLDDDGRSNYVTREFFQPAD